MARKRGPEPLPPDQRRRHSVGVYLTDAERQKLESLAIPGGTAGMSELGIRRRLARHLRSAGLESAPPQIPAINREAWAELSRLAANLNQQQRAINEGRAAPGPVDLAELRASVDTLRRELIGAPAEDENDEK